MKTRQWSCVHACAMVKQMAGGAALSLHLERFLHRKDGFFFLSSKKGKSARQRKRDSLCIFYINLKVSWFHLRV